MSSSRMVLTSSNWSTSLANGWRKWVRCDERNRWHRLRHHATSSIGFRAAIDNIERRRYRLIPQIQIQAYSATAPLWWRWQSGPVLPIWQDATGPEQSVSHKQTEKPLGVPRIYHDAVCTCLHWQWYHFARDSRKSRQKIAKKHGILLWKSQKSRQFI